MKRLITILLLLLCVTSYAAGEWTPYMQWWGQGLCSDPNPLNGIYTTEVFDIPSMPWGCSWYVEQIDKTKGMPVFFGIVAIPEKEKGNSQTAIVILNKTLKNGNQRIYNRCKRMRLMITAVNCRWTITTYKTR